MSRTTSEANAGGIAAELVDEGMRGSVSFDVLPDAFLRAFYMKWLSEVVQLRPPLARFDALTHEQRIAVAGGSNLSHGDEKRQRRRPLGDAGVIGRKGN